MQKRRSRLLATGTVSALALAMTALPAVAQDNGGEPEVAEVRGRASGIFFDLHQTFEGEEISATFGPAPEVVLPPEGGGPFTDSLAEAILDIGGEEATPGTDLEVSTEGALGPEGFAEASAAATVESGDVVVDAIQTECRTDLVDGPTGSTTILGAEISPLDPGDDPITLPENPEPNTVILDFEDEFTDAEYYSVDSLYVIVNEQTVTETDITVTGLRIVGEFQEFEDDELIGEQSFEMAVAESSCGLDVTEAAEPIEPPEPADEVVAPLDEALAVATPRFTG